MWNRVTVVGCGLIGASFALALKQSGAAEIIAGWDISETVLDEALRLGIIHEIDRSLAAGEPCPSDLVYLAMPVAEIINFLETGDARLKPGAVVTDAGSTKKKICHAAQTHLAENIAFIGGHPIAGSHLCGPANARATLFSGAPYVMVSENGGNNTEAVKTFGETLQLIGARPEFISAEEHDRTMALLSHLPQVLSSALSTTVANSNAPLTLAGPGYRDMTRLSASAWSMWHDILATNSLPIADALTMLIERLSIVRDELLKEAVQPSDGLPLSRNLFVKSSSEAATYPGTVPYDSHTQAKYQTQQR